MPNGSGQDLADFLHSNFPDRIANGLPAAGPHQHAEVVPGG